MKKHRAHKRIFRSIRVAYYSIHIWLGSGNRAIDQRLGILAYYPFRLGDVIKHFLLCLIIRIVLD